MAHGLAQDGAERAAHDESHRTYREYLIRRLRLPAGVVYGHGLVNLGVLQVAAPNSTLCWMQAHRHAQPLLTCGFLA